MKSRSDIMIAEIHGKISSSGSNLSERMEDKLTGDFFGNLRYLPYEKGLKLLLDEMIIHKGNLGKSSDNSFNVKNSFISDRIEFWPNHVKAELDLSIDLENLFIGIEVKYESGLSGKDQLLRELKVINDKRNHKKGLLLFIAQKKGISEAIEAIDEIGKDIYLLDNISFAHISWEDIYDIYNKLNLENYNEYEKLIIEDIRRLLEYKGFEKFKDFELDGDYNIQESYFKFNWNISLDFNFQFNIKIEEGFYEFR